MESPWCPLQLWFYRNSCERSSSYLESDGCQWLEVALTCHWWKKSLSPKKFFLTKKIFFVAKGMKHEKNAKKCIFIFFFRRPIFRPSIARWPIFCIRWKALEVLYNFDFMKFFVRGRLHIIKLTGAAAPSCGTGTSKCTLTLVRIRLYHAKLNFLCVLQ